LNKGRDIRVVDLNQKLKEHVQEVSRCRAPDSSLYFRLHGVEKDVLPISVVLLSFCATKVALPSFVK